MTTREAQNKTAMKVRCPLCGAQPYFKCRRARSMKDARSVSLQNVHKQRIEAAANEAGEV